VLLAALNIASIASLVFTLRNARLAELREDLLTLDWSWMTVAIVSAVVIFLCQALRWQLILRPVAPLGFWETARALYVGMFANEVLPLRAGEVIRCYLVARTPALPLSVALTSILIERVFDGIWLFAALMVMLPSIPLPPNLRYVVDGAYALGIGILLLAAVLGGLMFWKRGSPETTGTSNLPDMGNWRGKLRKQVRILIEDLGKIGHSGNLAQAFLVSLIFLLLQTIPIYLTLQAYELEFSLSVAFSLALLLRMGSAIPQAPANPAIPIFMATILQRVFLFGRGESARVGLLLWAVVTLPLLVSGLVALAVTDMKWGDLLRAAQNNGKIEE